MGFSLTAAHTSENADFHRSPAYQVIVKKSSDGESKITQTLQQGNHSGVILEPKGLAASGSNAPGAKTIRNITSSVSDTTSNPSPPTLSPKEFSELPLPPELSQLPETFQNLIVGKVSDENLVFKTRKIVLYVCAADSQDCCVEKGVLHKVVVPELRSYCRDKGYELHITDLHWKTGLEKQQDHEFPELCLGELNRQMEVGYIIPVLFLSNSLGTPLLPKTVETQDFEMALSQADDKDSLKKWYKLDSDAQPPCYRLQPVAYHIPGFKEKSWEMRERALEEWRTEIERTLTAMIAVFPEELRNTYLTTVVEQEVHNTILMSQELARRCLWLYRVFTQKPESNVQLSILEQEQKRRLDIIYKELRSQLTEKHVIRLSVKWNQDGIVDQNIPEHAQYVNDVTSHLMKYLKATIFNIIEEDQSKAVIRSMFGVESQFLNELKWQAMYCQKAALSAVDREQILQEVQSYLTGDATTPLFIHGAKGSGKTTVLTRAIHCIHTWVPDSFAIFRFTMISELSYSLINIIKCVCDQLSLLAYGYHTYCDYDLSSYEVHFAEFVSAIAIQRPVIIIFDGLDQIDVTTLNWLPSALPNNAKLIISSATDSKLYNQLKMKFPSDIYYKEIRELSKTEAESLLVSSVTQYTHSVNAKISQTFLSALQYCTLPLYIKVLAWRASWFTQIDHNFDPKTNLKDEMDAVLDFVDAMLGANRVRIVLSLIAVSKYGLRDSELLEMLSHETDFHSGATYLKWAPACLFLSRITKFLSPFLNWVSDGNNLTLKISNQSFEEIIRQRYVQLNPTHNQIIQQYFKGSLNVESAENMTKFGSYGSRCDKANRKRALIEVPFQAIVLKQDIIDDYLLNSSWLFEKICACGVFQVLEDLTCVKNRCPSRLKDLEVLQRVLKKHHISLNYDGRQMYSKFYEELSGMESLGPFWKRFFEETHHSPTNSLLPIMKELPLVGDYFEKQNNFDQHSINLIVRLNENPNFMVSVSTEGEEIAVWDLYSCEKVRSIEGVTHPISLQLIDDYRAVVLCRRELRIYNLDEGVLLTKLKGVMNQKMAYFGLHDKNHLVALSRNRMYVNLMHLESGDCIATFKAGEDRFLNSLLVSGDGRILVCGDETQKPFPLLVWNLSSRKLLYDLRIPHHEFITSLSAITHEGHYVCCVAKEVDEPGPNFIVVYDLQSGTLFKKWKPGVDTTSLDISSKDSCVISGLADARILVWDLVTGNCRWSLRGHSAPVTYVRRDPCGGSFMSADVSNRDRSFRLWDLNKGELLAVYTPAEPFSACELGIGGKTIAVSLKGEKHVRTLTLKGPGIEEPNTKLLYGKLENHKKVFNLSENQNAR